MPPKEQKNIQNTSRIRQISPLAFLDKIDGNSKKLKMLVNSLRDRSAKEDESFWNDSDLEKQEVMTENRNFKIHHYQEQKKEEFQRLYKTPRPNVDIGDACLAYRPLRRPQVISEIELSRVSKAEGKNLSMHPSSRKQITFAGDQQQNKQLDLCPNVNKKQASFRITSKIDQLKKQRDQTDQRRGDIQTAEQQFELQSFNSYLVVSHLYSIRLLDSACNPEEIFTFFQSIYSVARLKTPKNPVIKRYKNCIYYGVKPKTKKQIHRGMVWHYRKLLYYGQMWDGKKHGTGVEINISKEGVVSKGKFVDGQKTGYFSIESNKVKYYGMLKNGQYHGEGHLITNNWEYKGSFCQGIKEGKGWEKNINKSQYKGDFFNDKFDGQGELKAPNYFYKGMFKCGKLDGRGFERTDQYEYLGDFVMGLKQGRGKIKTADGTTIQCSFWNGLAVEQTSKSPKHSSRLILEPNLTKQLIALNQQSEEGTIQNVLNAISKV